MSIVKEYNAFKEIFYPLGKMLSFCIDKIDINNDFEGFLLYNYILDTVRCINMEEDYLKTLARRHKVILLTISPYFTHEIIYKTIQFSCEKAKLQFLNITNDLNIDSIKDIMIYDVILIQNQKIVEITKINSNAIKEKLKGFCEYAKIKYFRGKISIYYNDENPSNKRQTLYYLYVLKSKLYYMLPIRNDFVKSDTISVYKTLYSNRNALPMKEDIKIIDLYKLGRTVVFEKLDNGIYSRVKKFIFREDAEYHVVEYPDANKTHFLGGVDDKNKWGTIKYFSPSNRQASEQSGPILFKKEIYYDGVYYFVDRVAVCVPRNKFRPKIKDFPMEGRFARFDPENQTGEIPLLFCQVNDGNIVQAYENDRMTEVDIKAGTFYLLYPRDYTVRGGGGKFYFYVQILSSTKTFNPIAIEINSSFFDSYHEKNFVANILNIKNNSADEKLWHERRFVVYPLKIYQNKNKQMFLKNPFEITVQGRNMVEAYQGELSFLVLYLVN